jgi:hypothetical protein
MIHLVFHVSQLKRVVSSTTTVSFELLDVANELQIPMEIPDHRLYRHRNTMTPQVLGRWSYLPDALSTWEDEIPLRQQFPRALALGQAGSKGGGSVTDHTTTSTSGEVVGDEAIIGRSSEDEMPSEDIARMKSAAQDKPFKARSPTCTYLAHTG